ncbi:1 TM domain-containing transmembrane protein [Acrasis kona]|uniref:1 TM domain-containing transmembrane protein n=1 Tax=Acrasis kona TaxID=1008807 RepID=A0AAW2Z9H2_9EUKA
MALTPDMSNPIQIQVDTKVPEFFEVFENSPFVVTNYAENKFIVRTFAEIESNLYIQIPPITYFYYSIAMKCVNQKLVVYDYLQNVDPFVLPFSLEEQVYTCSVIIKSNALVSALSNPKLTSEKVHVIKPVNGRVESSKADKYYVKTTDAQKALFIKITTPTKVDLDSFVVYNEKRNVIKLNQIDNALNSEKLEGNSILYFIKSNVNSSYVINTSDREFVVPTPTPIPTEPEPSKLTDGQIAGIVIGSLAGALILIVIAVFVGVQVRKYMRERSYRQLN